MEAPVATRRRISFVPFALLFLAQVVPAAEAAPPLQAAPSPA